MGKQAKISRLWHRNAAEAREDARDIPAIKLTGGARPLNGLCCAGCHTKAFDKLSRPRRGSCGHPVFQDNVTLCAKCAFVAADGPLCRSCGKSVRDLLAEDKEAEKCFGHPGDSRTKPIGRR